MADRRFARPALAGLATLALLGAATVAPAHVRHQSTRSSTHHATHATTHHATEKRRVAARHDHRATRLVAHRDAAPSGATSVPAGGLKVYCPARKGPLMIRKATQGAGTTVTVVCR